MPWTFPSSWQVPLVCWREVRRDPVLISVDYFELSVCSFISFPWIKMHFFALTFGIRNWCSLRRYYFWFWCIVFRVLFRDIPVIWPFWEKWRFGVFQIVRSCYREFKMWLVQCKCREVCFKLREYAFNYTKHRTCWSTRPLQASWNTTWTCNKCRGFAGLSHIESKYINLWYTTYMYIIVL